MVDGNGDLATKGRAERSLGARAGNGAAGLGSDRPRVEVPPENTEGCSPRQKVLIGLETFVSLCGLGGGIFMATHPLTAMSLHYLDGTWFHTWRWPGLALVLFVGVCPALVVVATLVGRHEAVLGHLCVGIGLVAWVALEAGWMVVSPGLQIAFGAIGVLIIALATRELIPARTASRGPKLS